MLISLISMKGSPGTSTAALALAAAWPRPVVVVDADPTGGDISAGLGRGTWPPRATLGELVIAARSTPVGEALRRLVVRPAPHSPPVLAGLGSPAQAAAVPWQRLARGFRDLSGADVVLDAGRWITAAVTAPLLRESDQVVLVTGSALGAVRVAARAVPELRAELTTVDDLLALLVVGPGRPYPASEIAAAIHVELLGVLPWDERGAQVWSDGVDPGRRFAHGPLQRAARQVAQRLAGPYDTAVGAS